MKVYKFRTLPHDSSYLFGDGNYVWKNLNPTGLCKTVKDEYGTKNYVQHQGRFFKHWINSQLIEKFEVSTDIYNCPEYTNPGS